MVKLKKLVKKINKRIKIRIKIITKILIVNSKVKKQIIKIVKMSWIILII